MNQEATQVIINMAIRQMRCSCDGEYKTTNQESSYYPALATMADFVYLRCAECDKTEIRVFPRKPLVAVSPEQNSSPVEHLQERCRAIAQHPGNTGEFRFSTPSYLDLAQACMAVQDRILRREVITQEDLQALYMAAMQVEAALDAGQQEAR